jgi:hypothetical protein
MDTGTVWDTRWHGMGHALARYGTRAGTVWDTRWHGMGHALKNHIFIYFQILIQIFPPDNLL